MDETIDLRICLKDEGNKVFCILKKVKKDTLLKDIRNMHAKKKITSEFQFIDNDNAVSSDIEEDYSVEDILDENRIYIKRKKNEDSAPPPQALNNIDINKKSISTPFEQEEKHEKDIKLTNIAVSINKEINNKKEATIKEDSKNNNINNDFSQKNDLNQNNIIEKEEMKKTELTEAKTPKIEEELNDNLIIEKKEQNDLIQNEEKKELIETNIHINEKQKDIQEIKNEHQNMEKENENIKNKEGLIQSQENISFKLINNDDIDELNPKSFTKFIL